MRWRILLSEFDFEVQFKKRLLSTQADALSRLPTNAEAKPVGGLDIPCVLAEHEEDDIDSVTEHFDMCDAILTTPPARPMPGNVVPNKPEEMVLDQQSDPLRTRIRARLNGGAQLLFLFNHQVYLIRIVRELPRIVVPHSLQCGILALSEHAKLSAHPGRCKLY